MVFNGKDENGKLYNARLSYKRKSIIVDYEHCLHAYSKIPMEKVPVEVYPYKEDIFLTYISVDKKYGKVDLAELYEMLVTLCQEEELQKKGD